MPVTTTNNINTIIGRNYTFGAVRLTIEDIERKAKDNSHRNAYLTFESFLNHLKNKKRNEKFCFR
jgi:hypothetical protein